MFNGHFNYIWQCSSSQTVGLPKGKVQQKQLGRNRGLVNLIFGKPWALEPGDKAWTLGESSWLKGPRLGM